MNRSRRTACITAAILVAALLSPPLQAQEREALPSHPSRIQAPSLAWQPPAPGKMRTVFPRGLRAYVCPVPGAAAVRFNVFVARGYLHDPVDRPGLMELTCEAMLAGGTTMWSPGNLRERLDLLGIDIRASVRATHTVLCCSFPPASTRKALFLLAEVILSPAFDSTALDRVRRRLANRALALWDEPGRLALSHSRRLLFGQRPLRKRAVLQDLEAIERSTHIKACHTQAFRPSNMVLTVSGAVEQAAVRDVLEYKFDKADSGAPPAAPGVGNPTALAGIHLFPCHGPLAALVLGTRTATVQTAAYRAFELLALLLDREGSHEITAARDGDGAVHLVQVTPVYEAGPALARLAERLAAVAGGDVDAEAVEIARRRLAAAVQARFATPQASCETFASLEARSLPLAFYDTYLTTLDTVSPPDVSTAAKALRDGSKAFIVVAGDPVALADGEVKTGVKFSSLGKVTRHK